MPYAHFTLAYWCVLLAALLHLCAGIAKAGMFGKSRKDGGYDNGNPRAWLAPTDRRARANAAQPQLRRFVFIGAVIIAHQLVLSSTVGCTGVTWCCASSTS